MSHSMAISANPLSSGLSLQNLGASTGKTKLRAADTSGSTTSGTTGTSSTSTSSGTDSIGTTFLSLLVQELQNQDPTAPMDSTAMVGQMISLNQLDQLTSINQTLSTAYGGSSTNSSSTSGTTSGTTQGTSSDALTNALGGSANQAATTSAATAAAMRLLASSGFSSQPGVSTSVSLPVM